jgi:hypothetical protein
VPVGVVRAGRHERHPGLRGREEAAVGVRAAVVGHLEHVGAQVDGARDDPRLGLAAQVAGEQDAHPALGHPDDQGQVVGRGRRPGDLRRRGEDLDRGRPDRPPVPRDEDRAFRAGAAHLRLEPADPVLGRRQRPGGDHAHLPPRQGAGQAPGVVGVEVGDQHQRQLVDAQPVQAPVDRAHVRAGVDQYALSGRGRDDQRVALPDVAGNHDGPVGRPASGELPDRPAQDDDADEDRERDRPGPGEAPQQPAHDEQEHGQEHRAAGAGRPRGRAVRQGGRALRDDHQPPDRPAGQPHQRVGQRRDDHRDQGGQQAEHGRRGDGRGGEQVGRQGDRADQPRQTGHQRRGHEAGRGSHRDRVGQHGRPPPAAQPPRPAGREQHDGGGGRDRQREAGVPGQARIDQEQHRHRPTEGRHGGSRPSRGECQQRDRAHRRGPDHARLGPGEHDEAGQRHERHRRLHPPVDRAAAQRCEDTGDHDRDVGA